MNAIPLQDPSIFVWSDSQIVLHWVNSHKQLPAFVCHCITEMQSQLPTAEWRYCPTLENSADLLTRGITTETLISSALWQNGPAWLTTPDRWPSLDQQIYHHFLLQQQWQFQLSPTHLQLVYISQSLQYSS